MLVLCRMDVGGGMGEISCAVTQVEDGHWIQVKLLQ